MSIKLLQYKSKWHKKYATTRNFCDLWCNMLKI